MDAAEAFFELFETKFDERGSTVGACVGHGAVAEILDEPFEFGAAEEVVGFDGVAADGFCDHRFTEAECVDIETVAFELVEHFDDKLSRLAGFHEGRQGIEQEGAFAELAEAHTEAAEHGEERFEKLGVADTQFDRFGKEQFLGGGISGLETFEHLLEEYAFVCGVLV